MSRSHSKRVIVICLSFRPHNGALTPPYVRWKPPTVRSMRGQSFNAPGIAALLRVTVLGERQLLVPHLEVSHGIFHKSAQLTFISYMTGTRHPPHPMGPAACSRTPGCCFRQGQHSHSSVRDRGSRTAAKCHRELHSSFRCSLAPRSSLVSPRKLTLPLRDRRRSCGSAFQFGRIL